MCLSESEPGFRGGAIYLTCAVLSSETYDVNPRLVSACQVILTMRFQYSIGS